VAGSNGKTGCKQLHTALSLVYLDEGEFAVDVERVVGDDNFAVMINPTLTAKQIVNARRCFVPSVQFTRPSNASQ